MTYPVFYSQKRNNTQATINQAIITLEHTAQPRHNGALCSTMITYRLSMLYRVSKHQNLETFSFV